MWLLWGDRLYQFHVNKIYEWERNLFIQIFIYFFFIVIDHGTCVCVWTIPFVCYSWVFSFLNFNDKDQRVKKSIHLQHLFFYYSSWIFFFAQLIDMVRSFFLVCWCIVCVYIIDNYGIKKGKKNQISKQQLKVPFIQINTTQTHNWYFDIKLYDKIRYYEAVKNRKFFLYIWFQICWQLNNVMV